MGSPPKLAPDATVWAGYSGGLDSTVLLHLLKQSGLPLKALHVNHHLQVAANRWVDHCREFSAVLGVPIYVMDVKVDPRDPDGPEAAARGARYGAIRGLMKPGDCLATAHHQDDQAETVMLRLVRGAGVAGLAAMRSRSEFSPGILWRPLLRCTREQLRHYAEHYQLSWVEDPHNLDPRYSRTFLRTELFPRLQQRWPQAIELLARTADHCADAVELLDELAVRDLQNAEQDGALSVRALLSLPRARRNNLLRYWVAHAGHETPTFDALSQLEKEVLRARPDASPLLAWGETELRRFRDSLYLMPRLPPPPKGAVLEWNGRHDLELPPGCGWLRVIRSGPPALRIESSAGSVEGDRGGANAELPLRVVFPKGGERIKPAGSRYTRTLRNLFQEEAIPGWVRERVPLIQLEGELVAVADRWLTGAFKKLCQKHGLKLEWQHNLVGHCGN